MFSSQHDGQSSRLSNDYSVQPGVLNQETSSHHSIFLDYCLDASYLWILTMVLAYTYTRYWVFPYIPCIGVETLTTSLSIEHLMLVPYQLLSRVERAISRNKSETINYLIRQQSSLMRLWVGPLLFHAPVVSWAPSPNNQPPCCTMYSERFSYYKLAISTISTPLTKHCVIGWHHLIHHRQSTATTVCC